MLVHYRCECVCMCVCVVCVADVCVCGVNVHSTYSGIVYEKGRPSLVGSPLQVREREREWCLLLIMYV